MAPSKIGNHRHRVVNEKVTEKLNELGAKVEVIDFGQNRPLTSGCVEVIVGCCDYCKKIKPLLGQNRFGMWYCGDPCWTCTEHRTLPLRSDNMTLSKNGEHCRQWRIARHGQDVH